VPPAIFELQGYAIVLDKVVFLTRVFEAEGGARATSSTSASPATCC